MFHPFFSRIVLSQRHYSNSPASSLEAFHMQNKQTTTRSQSSVVTRAQVWLKWGKTRVEKQHGEWGHTSHLAAQLAHSFANTCLKGCKAWWVSSHEGLANANDCHWLLWVPVMVDQEQTSEFGRCFADKNQREQTGGGSPEEEQSQIYWCSKKKKRTRS